VSHAKEWIPATRRGKAVPAVVSIENRKLLRAIENKIELKEARKALTEVGENIPWEKVKQTWAISRCRIG
jgi:hypothetical protein